LVLEKRSSAFLKNLNNLLLFSSSLPIPVRVPHPVRDKGAILVFIVYFLIFIVPPGMAGRELGHPDYPG
jgi:hypothetical protein